MDIKKIDRKDDDALFIGKGDGYQLHLKMVEDACKEYNAVVHPSCLNDDGDTHACYDSFGVYISYDNSNSYYGHYILLKSIDKDEYYLLDVHDHYYQNLEEAFNDEADELVDIINSDDELPREEICYGWYYVSWCSSPRFPEEYQAA